MLELQILIIDSEPNMLRGLERILSSYEFGVPDFEEKIGFKVFKSETGRDALNLLDENYYDIVLIDYQINDVECNDIIEFIKSKKYETLSVMMTSFSSLDTAISATRSGAFDILVKPFTPEELRSVIRKTATNIVLMRRAKKLEEEKKKVRFQFLSVLSHELKAPLNAIESYLRLLDDRVAGNDIATYDEMIKRSMSRIGGMRKLIYDLLDLTRIESGEKVRTISKVNLIDAVNNSIETNSVRANERNIKLILNSPENLEIFGELSELEIMFNNLISNSVKYNKDNGSVTIDISSDSELVKISVTDTGIGMKKEELKKLFGEFVRFKNENTTNIEGSGLGLSILKKLVSLYNGSIKVESEYGQGTTFHIQISRNSQITN